MQLTRLSIAIFCLALATIGYASSEGDNRWVHNGEAGWCLLFDANEICLPSEYDLTTFGNGYAEFRSRPDSAARSLINYASSPFRTPTEQLNSLILSDTLVQANTQYHGELTIIEFVPPISQLEEMHGVTLFILIFGDRFTLTVFGPRHDENKELARALWAQWSASSD